MFYHFQHFLSIAGAGMHFSDLQLFLINPGPRAALDAAVSRESSREFQDRKSETFPPQWTWWIVGTCCICIYIYALCIVTWYIQILHQYFTYHTIHIAQIYVYCLFLHIYIYCIIFVQWYWLYLHKMWCWFVRLFLSWHVHQYFWYYIYIQKDLYI